MKSLTAVCSALVILLATGPLAAQETVGEEIVSTVQQGCAAEIESFCSQVTLGDGRLLACFYAHEDKLSGQCQYSLYRASAELDQAVNALAYLAAQCENDILNLCATVQAGEGRILECLDANSEAVSDSCKTAISETVVQ
jgi:hypothetical protein